MYILEPFVKLVVAKTHVQYEHIFFRKSIRSKIFGASSIHLCPTDTWSKITWTGRCIPFYFSYWLLQICFYLALFLDNPFRERFPFLRWNIWKRREERKLLIDLVCFLLSNVPLLSMMLPNFIKKLGLSFVSLQIQSPSFATAEYVFYRNNLFGWFFDDYLGFWLEWSDSTRNTTRDLVWSG